MSEVAAAGGLAARRRARTWSSGSGTDARRVLQLILAVLWLLDGVLQYQPFMYTKAFGQSLAATAPGNPGVIARPITWDATVVEHHVVLLNSIFATSQLLLGLGIAFRPTVRVALAASVAWSIAVWWFGEGLGGVLINGASPLNGAPGAVILYALAAVLLWPSDRRSGQPSDLRTPAPFPAARAVGAHVARALWLVLWLSLAYFTLIPVNRAPQAMNAMIASMASGNPGWLSALVRAAASLVADQGLAASIVLAIALAVIGVGVYLPSAAARASVVLAIVISLVIWIFAEAVGGILAGGATDPNSGPLLALLALAYWPPRKTVVSGDAVASTASGTSVTPTASGVEGGQAR
jgi:hypothetical protein